MTCPCVLSLSLSECVDFKEKIGAVSCGDDVVTLLSERGNVVSVDSRHAYIPRYIPYIPPANCKGKLNVRCLE